MFRLKVIRREGAQGTLTDSKKVVENGKILLELSEIADELIEIIGKAKISLPKGN